MDWYPAWVFLIFCKAMSHFFYIVRCILHVFASKVYSIYYSYSKQVVHYANGGRSWYADYDMMESFSTCQYMSQEKWEQNILHLRPILSHDQMETFSVLLTFYVGNSPVTCEFPPQIPVMQSFDVFFDLRLNKRVNKQSRRRWFKTPMRSLWHRCNDSIGPCQFTA